MLGPAPWINAQAKKMEMPLPGKVMKINARVHQTLMDPSKSNACNIQAATTIKYMAAHARGWELIV
jgi:hypothetical protein